MMDFLRRLAPARASDTTRAVALLPARFASDHPLDATFAGARPGQGADGDQAPGDDLAATRPDAAAPVPASATPAAQGRRSGAVPPPPAPAMPQGPAAAPAPAAGKAAPVPPPLAARAHAGPAARVPAGAPAPQAAAARSVQERQGAGPAPAGPAMAARQGQAAAFPALRVFAAPERAAAPLSQAVLAQRALQSRSDSQEVHVTIGRIDVATTTAPAPAARRPAPRPASLPLADYLRGNRGGRQ